MNHDTASDIKMPPATVRFYVSSDDGATFGDVTEIENDPLRGFCYCAAEETSDALLLGYCAGGEEDQSCLTRTRIRRIPKIAIAGLTVLRQSGE